jgi:uncharacterized protein YdbL (DUF1318 family)
MGEAGKEDVMSALRKAVVNTLRRRLLSAGAAALLLAGCETDQSARIEVHTAAGGTLIEAKQVVALVDSQAPDPAIDRLLYTGGDLTRAVRRLRDLNPDLKPLLDDGVVGNTAGGYVALRQPSRRGDVGPLVREVNRVRALLYAQASIAVGHGDDDLNAWLPYAAYSFGKEWIDQGRAGWWWRDDRGEWRRK